LIVNGERDSLIINDTESHPIASGLLPTSMGIKSFCGIPIILSNGDLFGNLCAFDTTRHTFTQNEVQFLETMAVFLAHTIELDYIAYHDRVTGLTNRDYLLNYVSSINDGEQVAILFLDVDGFKYINDQYGHHTGDAVLHEVANRLRECINHENILCRYAGDEFIIIVQGEQLEKQSIALSEMILTKFSYPFIVKGDSLELTVSIGIRIETIRIQNINELIQEADVGMYLSKRKGKNQYNLYNPHNLRRV
jgi:diguanylate cyclase (GGDEF)-like protein